MAFSNEAEKVGGEKFGHWLSVSADEDEADFESNFISCGRSTLAGVGASTDDLGGCAGLLVLRE